MSRNFDIRRIVVKVGSSCLVSGMKLDKNKMKKLVGEIADLKDEGKEVILVTSGAIAAGSSILNLKLRPIPMPLQQASAAIGQGILMHEYKELFNERGYDVAQLLLTQESFSQRERYLNVGNTLSMLLKRGIIPIVNENDAIAIDELDHGKTGCFDDNDKLSALVAGKMGAGLLIMLSDVDGLYSDNPRRERNVELISLVENVDEVRDMAKKRGNSMGKGGMEGKIDAADIAARFGIPVVIANSEKANVLMDIIDGKEVGTLFLARGAMSHKKRWISFSTSIKGSLVIDEGAKIAITEKGARLLPAGISYVLGTFSKGDVINIVYDDRVIARGLTNYSSEELDSIKGVKTHEIEGILGRHAYKEVINRDNMVML